MARSRWVKLQLVLALVAAPGAQGDGPAGEAQSSSLSTSVKELLEGEGTASPSTDAQLPQLWSETPEAPLTIPNRLSSPPIAQLKPLDPKHDLVGRAILDESGAFRLPGKEGALLTLDASLQRELQQILREYETPYGAVVAVEPSTGKVLAMAEHAQEQPGMRGLCTKAVFPAASIFKIVTAAALLEAGLGPEDSACFHGGKRKLHQKLLLDSPRDRHCYTLAAAMGKSANVVFAKLALKHLTADKLRQFAAAFRFNRPLPFAVPTEVSLARVPEDPFHFASTGAGFGDVYLSPLHGAMIAATAANKGLWRPPVLIEDELERALGESERVMSEQHALDLTEMLEETVTSGTARGIFRQRGFAVPNAVGKTGTLADRSPFRDYSWFVGFAPKENPKVAVGAVVVNGPKWRIRATYLGREAMRLHLRRELEARSRPVQANQSPL